MKQQGFTLIELIVVIIITGILSAAAGSMLVVGTRSDSLAQNLIDLNSSGESALGAVVKRLTNIRSNTTTDITASISGGTTSQIEFTTMTDDDVIIYEDSGFLYERVNGNDGLLTSNLSSGPTFTFYDQNGDQTSTVTEVHYIGIDFTLSASDQSTNFSQTVYLRNS